jgi:L-lysine exporter family protein LysE/ArgO
MHIFLTGILLGLGVAIPIGPINIEQMRRTLAFGFWSGITIGIGATCVDILYIVLLMTGALFFLTNVIILKVIGFLGALLLAWFGYSCFKKQPHISTKNLVPQSVFRTFCVGFLLNLLSPFPILFWVSISSQMISLSMVDAHGIVLAALGVIVGTMAWNFSMTMVLHKTRHLISEKVMRWFNITGGIILIAFAIIGLTRVFLI